MEKNTIENFMQTLKLFMAMAACLVCIVAFFWVMLGTFVMQLLSVGLLLTGVFLLGSWWNDHVQDKERKHSIQLLNSTIPLMVADIRGSTRTGVAQIESSASYASMLQDANAVIQEVE